MVDVKPAVFDRLSEIQGAAVSYMYPKSFVKLPAIAYCETANEPHSGADDSEYTSAVEIKVDIWDDSVAGITGFASEVNSRMVELGFYRTASFELYEQDSGLHHKIMRFRGVF